MAAATSIPSLLSIPCFYYAGLRYVDHKKREEMVIEAADSYETIRHRDDVKNLQKDITKEERKFSRHNSKANGLVRVSSSMKLTKSSMRAAESSNGEIPFFNQEMDPNQLTK